MRRRVKQTRSLHERMAEQAAKLKAVADQLPVGRSVKRCSNEHGLLRPVRT